MRREHRRDQVPLCLAPEFIADNAAVDSSQHPGHTFEISYQFLHAPRRRAGKPRNWVHEYCRIEDYWAHRLVLVIFVVWPVLHLKIIKHRLLRLLVVLAVFINHPSVEVNDFKRDILGQIKTEHHHPGDPEK